MERYHTFGILNTHLVLSYPIQSQPEQSFPIIFYPIPSYYLQSHFIPFLHILFHTSRSIQSYPWLILSLPLLSYSIPSHLQSSIIPCIILHLLLHHPLVLLLIPSSFHLNHHIPKNPIPSNPIAFRPVIIHHISSNPTPSYKFQSIPTPSFDNLLCSISSHPHNILSLVSHPILEYPIIFNHINHIPPNPIPSYSHQHHAIHPIISYPIQGYVFQSHPIQSHSSGHPYPTPSYYIPSHYN